MAIRCAHGDTTWLTSWWQAEVCGGSSVGDLTNVSVAWNGQPGAGEDATG